MSFASRVSDSAPRAEILPVDGVIVTVPTRLGPTKAPSSTLASCFQACGCVQLRFTVDLRPLSFVCLSVGTPIEPLMVSTSKAESPGASMVAWSLPDPPLEMSPRWPCLVAKESSPASPRSTSPAIRPLTSESLPSPPLSRRCIEVAVPKTPLAVMKSSPPSPFTRTSDGLTFWSLTLGAAVLRSPLTRTPPPGVLVPSPPMTVMMSWPAVPTTSTMSVASLKITTSARLWSPEELGAPG